MDEIILNIFESKGGYDHIDEHFAYKDPVMPVEGEFCRPGKFVAVQSAPASELFNTHLTFRPATRGITDSLETR